ncbi:MAG: response regulator transcription factor [bacterium]
MQKLKIAVFDDNKPRREMLQMLIDSTEEFLCTGAFEDCSNIVKNIAANTPDIILMDIDMPNVNGIEGLILIKEKFPKIKILMQTVFEDEEKIFKAVISGADGYILKKTPPAKLLDAIKDVAEGGSPMTPTIARQVLVMFNDKHKKPLHTEFNLTSRELEILELLVQGYSYKMIANKCDISYSTVNTHISHIYEKLQVESGTEAVAKALQNKITKGENFGR